MTVHFVETDDTEFHQCIENNHFIFAIDEGEGVASNFIFFSFPDLCSVYPILMLSST